jgi:hypothetical protein
VADVRGGREACTFVLDWKRLEAAWIGILGQAADGEGFGQAVRIAGILSLLHGA